LEFVSNFDQNGQERIGNIRHARLLLSIHADAGERLATFI